jgi:hypothetical protein
MRHPTISLVFLATITASVAASCGSESSERGGPPTAPATNDAAYEIVAAPRYILAGDALTPDTASFGITVKPPAGVTALEAWVDGQGPVRFTKYDDGAFRASYADAAALAAGEHTLLLAQPTSAAAFARLTFLKGHALYVVVSSDWDNPYNTGVQTDLQQALHVNHPKLKITHLVGPYTFTDPHLSQAQRDEMVSWVKTMRASYGDEIGTHIHPWCNFVEAVGLTCVTSPSFRSPDGDTTGYTVELGAYSYEQWMQMFARVDELWAAHDMGKPTAFRAGGWSLELPVMRALADSGYLADSSAVNWARMEEWQDDVGASLYQWNMAAWAPIGNTTQAYYPTEGSLLPGGSGATIPVLELTDNGILADYVLADEMIEIFHDNWDGSALAAPVEVSIGYHPPSIDYDDGRGRFFERLDDALTHIDGFLATEAQGPVLYITMSQAATVWPAP